MRLAIDASRTTVARITGTEHYALALIRALIDLNTKHEITLYFRDLPDPDLFSQSPLVKHQVIHMPRAWTHTRFAAAIWRERPDMTFVPAHTLPFVFPGRAVVTVHDLGYRHFPQSHTLSSRLYLDLTTRYSAWRASHILADSQATADDLNRFYGTRSEKISVVYPGVDAPVINDGDIRSKYELPEQYFLFIGTLQPRKNINRIVQAYAQCRTQIESPIGLVLAGRKGWLFDESWIKDIPDVHITGYIDDVDKGALYKNAVALVFPSLFEGFGFPVLEAMHCRTPVIASNTSSLPELVGEAGLLVDPLNIESISAAMIRVVADADLRSALIAKGEQQARKFTWQAAAFQTMTVLENVANATRP